MSKSTINGPFSIAMLAYQRVRDDLFFKYPPKSAWLIIGVITIGMVYKITPSI